MSRVVRRYEIDRQRRRRSKLRKLRQRCLKAKDTREREKITAKILRIHPWYPMELLKVAAA